MGPNSLEAPPSIIVTLDPVETVLAAYPNLAIEHRPESPKIFNNLIDAIAESKAYSTILVDMECNLQVSVHSISPIHTGVINTSLDMKCIYICLPVYI